MEPESPLNPSSPLTEEQLAALVRRVDGPAPSADFVARTMRAVKRAPLERRLRLLGVRAGSLVPKAESAAAPDVAEPAAAYTPSLFDA